jgi:pimeloyl-ACP methyl ester carboxylesterase
VVIDCDNRRKENPVALLAVNGAELYYEVRGSGPPVLLIMGFTGDGGNFETLAELLADEFTVVTYDRRGNGRSPPPGRLGQDLAGGAGRRRGRAARGAGPCASRGLRQQRRRELRPLPDDPPS